MNSDFRKLLESMSVSDQQLYQGIWNRKHISSSYFLRDAVRSSLVDSIRAASQWLENCKKAKLKCNSLAERVYIANINYSLMLPGAILSTIILSATAIEAFLRHCYVSVLRTKSSCISYATFLDKISAFNKKWPTDKIQDTISHVNADQLPDHVEAEIRDLFSFRNDVVHSDPIYHSSEFAKVIQIKQGKDKKMVEKKPRQYKYYADLTSTNRPLLLEHAIVATISHDKLIQHITGTAKDVDILDFLNEVDMTNNDSCLIWRGLMPGVDYKNAKILSQEMNSMNKELNKVGIREMTAFLKSITP
jgi:hypothetical protein